LGPFVSYVENVVWWIPALISRIETKNSISFIQLFSPSMFQSLQPGNPYWRGCLSTVDLLVLTSLDQLLVILQTTFTFFSKTRYLNKEVNRTEPSPSVSVRCYKLLFICQTQSNIVYFLSPDVSSDNWTQTLNIRIMKRVFYHCASAAGHSYKNQL
jgi:hypothetical protein